MLYEVITVEPGVIGATISGGGSAGSENRVFGNSGTIGGGQANTARHGRSRSRCAPGRSGGDGWSQPGSTVITSYSIHYTKLYELPPPGAPVSSLSHLLGTTGQRWRDYSRRSVEQHKVRMDPNPLLRWLAAQIESQGQRASR